VTLGEPGGAADDWNRPARIIGHTARTFFFGAYKYPRELNWVIGVV